MAKPTITAEEFISWRADPVTQAVIRELNRAAEMQKGAWMKVSWAQETPDPLQLAILKTRADAYRALAELSYEDLVEIAE